jgi:phenylacetate-CoA ligase
MVVKAVPGIARARLVVTREEDADVMTLQVEERSGHRPDLEAVASALSRHTGLKGRVELVVSLPNDGKVIDDKRDYNK